MMQIVETIRNKVDKNLINKLGIAVIIIYYFLGLLSYIIVPFTQIYKLFVSSSPVAIVIRALMIFMIVVYSLFVLITYKEKIKWRWAVVFASILLLTGLSILISPLTYQYIYTEDLYKVVHVVTLNPGVTRTAVMYFSSICDFVFAFCALFILPLVINDKKKLLYLLIPIVIIGLGECCYSIIKERSNYVYLFTHPDDPYSGYGHDIGATFGNKEDWGAFLTVSYSSASFCYINFKWDTVKHKILKISLITSLAIFTVFAVLSLCKTAILAIGLSIVVILTAVLVKTFKISKKRAFIVFGFYIAAIIFFVLFLVTRGFGIDFLGKIANYLINFIIGKSGNALNGRTSLWLNYLENVRGFNLFFGLGKAGVNTYTKSLVQEGQASIHNGLAYFFASYGLIGFCLLCVFIVFVVINICKLFKRDFYLAMILLAIFMCSISFVLSEAEVLVISSSNPIFVYNVLLVMFPIGYLLKEKRKAETL